MFVYATGAKATIRNAYVNLAGHVCMLPFDAKRDGLWRFDGQFYYLPKEQR